MEFNFATDTKRLICLAVLLGIYLLSGAAVFQVLENENEKLEVQQLNSVKRLFLQKHNMTSEDFDFLVEKVETAVRHRCGGDPDQWCTSRWTYYASLYFTWSVVTTVGKQLVCEEQGWGQGDFRRMGCLVSEKSVVPCRGQIWYQTN